MQKRFKLWYLLLLPVLLLGGRWVHLQIAYAQVEGLTQRYGEEFAPDLITYIDEVAE